MHNTVSLIIICLYIHEDETLFGCAKIYPNKSASGSFFAGVQLAALMEDAHRWHGSIIVILLLLLLRSLTVSSHSDFAEQVAE